MTNNLANITAVLTPLIRYLALTGDAEKLAGMLQSQAQSHTQDAHLKEAVTALESLAKIAHEIQSEKEHLGP